MGKHFKAKVGDVFGFLTVVGWNDNVKRWLCYCACGKATYASYGNMNNGHTTSCGCRRSAANKEIHKTHGLARTRIYTIWVNIKQRIFNPRCKEYKYYGGRGIAMNHEWAESFEAFLAGVGPVPSGNLSLDRKDNNGDYDIGNVRWVTMKVQNRNRRDNRLITHQGQTKTLAEWAEVAGLSHQTLFHRLGKLGWPVEKALTHKLRADSRRI